MFLPYSKEIIPQKIEEWEEKYALKKEEIKTILKNARRDFPKDAWFTEALLATLPEFVPSLITYEKHLYRLKRQLAFLKNKRTPLVNFQIKLDKARVYPIYELARDKLELRQVGRKFVALCPYHDERTPSFYLYPETNTFHCYGCGAHGDVINLTQQLHGLDFKEAVGLLQ